MYLGMTCFIQLSILLTRNPSFWWHFSKKRWGRGRGARGRQACTWVGNTDQPGQFSWQLRHFAATSPRSLPCSAPRPSIALVVPVVAFLLAAIFIAVYWPHSLQPDGGLAVMQGAGWVPVLVTLLYSLIWLQVGECAIY